MMLDDNYVSGGQLKRDVEYVRDNDGKETDWVHDNEGSWQETVADQTFIEAAKRLAEYIKTQLANG